MTETRSSYDLVVIGGGAGGLSAARAGQRGGADTLLINDGPLGGDCTFTGCVPSKAVIAAAHRGASFAEAMANAQDVVERIAATESADVLRGEGIDVLEGRAAFVSPTEVTVDESTITGRRFVVATGARAALPPIQGLDDIDVLTNENLWELTSAPGRLIVIGGGAIGCELAQATQLLGVDVTLVEALDRVLSPEEPEASEVVADALRADGVDLHIGHFAEQIEPMGTNGGARLTLKSGAVIEGDRVLVAAGRAPLTDGLDLDAAGVRTNDRGFVATDDRLRTNVAHIYGVGDVTGRLQFTHAADEMGRIAVNNALGVGLAKMRKARHRTHWTPWTTFTRPEVGRVGMTEAEAAEHGGRVAYLPMTEVDRALTDGRTAGFIKIIAGPNRILRNAAGGRVLGATVVADRGGELIHEPALAMRAGLFTGRLAQAIHAYPTWSIAVQKAASQFFVEVEGREARPAEAPPPTRMRSPGT